jgi:glycerol kinase
VTGAAVQWLRDELGIIDNAAESERLALSVPDTGGVYLVPAFAGLGAPYWDPHARGALVGLTRGSGRAQIARAALEAAAYSTRDVLDAMRRDTNLPIHDVRVDGGMTANDFLLQFQADIADVRVERPAVAETTALGAAFLAGLAVGFWNDLDAVAAARAVDAVFQPEMPSADREALYAGWRRAVDRSRGWLADEG